MGLEPFDQIAIEDQRSNFDLVGVIRAPNGHLRDTGQLGSIRVNFKIRVRQSSYCFSLKLDQTGTPESMN